MSFALVSRRSALTFGRRAVRFESTTSQKATEAAKQAAAKTSELSSKASEGLSRVSSAAGPALAKYAKGLSTTLGRVGGRTGKLIAFVERQTPFVIYYSKVAAELGRIVFRGQSMTPPSVSTFQTYFQNFVKSVQSGSFFSKAGAPLQNVRNISRTQVAAAGVLLAECLGFFTVGEMIGRLKLIGYHGETHAAAH
ncbi:mitochondrial ATP synthase g subunit-domain-containing protein [Sordaria brevicollis]|uniref:Mitochondrial ATP synthase g subunit-domain-containing protein n=1 Tax=Sordaria brevicollis TaxID=83679 RepID=A0AAE0P9H2_SORBR|nr:mitochondrial ATP synthase g subunit-domain-containing protein [Sordaria brevicollis]